ncbi:sugar phosphate isomerase/epimerase family protein [Oceanomicrobium pacificus]|uniref:TIM barrel protein n=1 Tax=Oceanomicrobium pacificus TaxID=2692916 RepID=A0A6B0TJ07_9RHOB|nr:TIM barrel protein [Oceanomicrobium pacificus]MXU64390.1 TIM barrel protein [Oceanomicrobium pacificus]
MRLGIEAGADTIEAAVELGIRGVPVDAAELASKGVGATLSTLKKHGLEVCQIGAFGFNPLSEDEAAQETQKDLLREVIPMAADTGCPYIVICGGNHHPSGFGDFDPRNWTEGAFDELVVTLQPFVALAARHGAKIAIEPYLKTAINHPERFHRLRERLSHPEALVANVDVTSLYDFRDYARPDQICREVCQGFSGVYGLGHIKDIGLEPGFHLQMGLAPLGTSPTNWIEVLRMMEPHMPKDSWLILEHLSDIEEARRSTAKLRDYAKEAGVSLT